MTQITGRELPEANVSVSITRKNGRMPFFDSLMRIAQRFPNLAILASVPIPQGPELISKTFTEACFFLSRQALETFLDGPTPLNFWDA